MTALDTALLAVQLYADKHPRPTQVSQTQAAQMLGISRWKVGAMVTAGTLRLNACGMIPIELVDAARDASERA